MKSLSENAAEAFIDRFDTFRVQATTLSEALSEDEFWLRPYPYGNSVGHLLLHVTGNLNYYIGAQIAGTGYVRNRDLEFTDPTKRPKADVLRDLDASVAMVSGTIRAQTADSWSAPYSAVGTDELNRFAIVLRCAHHFHHHLGQIIYLVKAHATKRSQ